MFNVRVNRHIRRESSYYAVQLRYNLKDIMIIIYYVVIRHTECNSTI